jgi:hypothetical protein
MAKAVLWWIAVALVATAFCAAAVVDVVAFIEQLKKLYELWKL